jgi:hypothetical protein
MLMEFAGKGVLEEASLGGIVLRGYVLGQEETVGPKQVSHTGDVGALAPEDKLNLRVVQFAERGVQGFKLGDAIVELRSSIAWRPNNRTQDFDC